jgi:hypothetical protein
VGFTKERRVRFPAVGFTRPVLFVRPASSEPTPWATGLTVTAIVAGVSLATDLVLSLSLRMSYGWLWIPANVLLCAGLSPTVWLLRNTPTWRWVSYGMVIGFGCAWLVMVIVVLTPGAAVATAGS